MTRTEFATGSAIFLTVIAAGWLSVRAVDRHFVTAETQTPPMPQGPCVDADGSWKNWPWSNVPMLSPKCKPDG
jgi:hypothetical protein